jgi:hypothetical protein
VIIPANTFIATHWGDRAASPELAGEGQAHLIPGLRARSDRWCIYRKWYIYRHFDALFRFDVGGRSHWFVLYGFLLFLDSLSQTSVLAAFWGAMAIS